MAKLTANPAVMAVKYCVRSVGFVKSIFFPIFDEIDLAFATILSSCEGGRLSTDSALFDDDRRRAIPLARKGVPDRGVDLPLALTAVVVVVAVEERPP